MRASEPAQAPEPSPTRPARGRRSGVCPQARRRLPPSPPIRETENSRRRPRVRPLAVFQPPMFTEPRFQTRSGPPPKRPAEVTETSVEPERTEESRRKQPAASRRRRRRRVARRAEALP
ncbi:hypothetical protein GCM10023238_28630 [Streptomyces heliomycini]